jgi:plasmid segregation protein ParM
MDMMQVYFVGGGAAVMRNFGRYQQPNIHYVLDVKANAKGFETMARIALRSGR